MLTTLDSSPTGGSINAVFTSCSSPTTEPSSTTVDQTREQLASPPSSKQDVFLAKRPSSRTKHCNRHQPYPDGSARSPGSCSSDGDSVQSDGDNLDSNGRPCKVKRVAANSRERKRMHTVNSAFDQLRELVPTYPSNRKLSKIDTLRLACTYIQDLVSLLHNSQGIQGEDVSAPLYHHQQHPFPDTTFNGFPVSVKQELSEFAPFTASPEHFRMQTAGCLRFPGHPDESYGSSASESDSTTHSPPHGFMQQNGGPPQQPQAPPASSRPPPLTRVSNEATASIHTQMAEASISSNGAQVSPLILPPPPPPPTSMYQRQVNITSPLAMHSVHHNTLHTSSLEHHSPPPIWQRPSPVPNGFALYGQ